MINRLASVTKGSFKGVTVWIQDTDRKLLGKPWYDHLVPASVVFADREATDCLPEDGIVFCGKHRDGAKAGLSDFFHESEIEFIEEN